jgi:hypothetical protein
MAASLRKAPVLLGTAAVAALGALVAGCADLGPEGPPSRLGSGHSAAAPPPFPQDRLIGKWGVASYRNEKDRARTEAQARSQCKLPYVIARGPTDGIMMHVADDPQLHELKLKGGPGGKAYIGFEGPAGDQQDREILTFSDSVFTARFVDPEVNTRYGIFVYVRCPG